MTVMKHHRQPAAMCDITRLRSSTTAIPATATAAHACASNAKAAAKYKNCSRAIKHPAGWTLATWGCKTVPGREPSSVIYECHPMNKSGHVIEHRSTLPTSTPATPQGQPPHQTSVAATLFAPPPPMPSGIPPTSIPCAHVAPGFVTCTQ